MQLSQWLKAMNANRPELGLLITPSWLSGLLAAVISVAVILGSAFAVQYQGSSLQLLREAQIKQQQPIDNSYAEVGGSLSRNEFVSNIPLLILWGGVGFVVYTLVINVLAAFKRVIDFEQELDYVHANRQQMIHTAIFHSVFRFGALAVWFLYLQFTLHILFPYAIALAYAGTGTAVRWESAGYLVMGIFLLALGIHLHVILLRLVMLKPRLFGRTA